MLSLTRAILMSIFLARRTSSLGTAFQCPSIATSLLLLTCAFKRLTFPALQSLTRYVFAPGALAKTGVDLE